MLSNARYLPWALALVVLAGCAKGPQSAASVQSADAARDGAMPVATVRAQVHGTFAALPDRGELLAYPTRQVRRDGAYTWHRTGLSEAYALRAIADGHMRVTTPSGELLDFKYDRHIEHPSGDWTWIGHLPGHEGLQSIITFGAHAAFGSIAQPDKLPLRLTVRDGASWLVETDGAKVAGIVNAATRPQQRDFFIPPGKHAGNGNGTAPGMASAQATAAAGTAATSTVDVVIGYTQGFAADNGGNSGAVTRLNYLVDVANAAYVNSGIPATARLVAAIPVTYTDTTSNDSTLEKLTGYDSTSNSAITPDPAFNALRAAREQYGADLVSLVRSFNEPENGGCGIAWLIGGGQSGVATSDSGFGYSVVSDGTDAGTDGKTYFCLDETLAHELGHNMGAAHDVATAKGSDGVLNADDYGAYPYSFGFKSSTPVTRDPAPGSGGGGAKGFYTVMAYGDTGQRIFRIFSDPRSTFCDGNACGTATQADNARTLTQTIPVIATFRATVVPVSGGLAIHNDVDGDGKSDLLFRNVAAQLLGWWEMNGASATATDNQVAGGAYVLSATGDFNGDGRTDLAWTNSARRLVVFTSTGSGFTSVVLSNDFGAGWTLVGAGDINGDGTSDLVFRNASSQLVSWWEMGDTKVLATRSQVAGGTYALDAIGDFNGDGKDDLAWANSARRLVLFMSTGTGFTSQTASNDFGAGWSLVTAGDINGDGKSDLIFRNAAAQQVRWWEMNGASIQATRSQAAGAAYTLSASGDFNGDGKTDLAWTTSTRRLVMFLSTGTAFTSVVVSNDFGSGWSMVD